MATVDAAGCSLYYEADGDGEPVAFVGDVGWGAWQWSAQHGGVAGPRKAIVWDLRGTGRSAAPPGPYDVDRLAADLEAVLGAAGADRAHLVGAGLGGMVALRYAREFGRARSLALFGTAATGEAVDAAALRALHPAERTPAALRASLAGALTEAFRDAHPDLVERLLEWREREDAPPAALEAQIAAMLAFEAGPRHEVGLPALVCHGDADPVVPPAAGEALAEDLPRGEYVPVAGRHLAHLEAGPAVTDRLLGFFDRVEGDSVEG